MSGETNRLHCRIAALPARSASTSITIDWVSVCQCRLVSGNGEGTCQLTVSWVSRWWWWWWWCVCVCVSGCGDGGGYCLCLCFSHLVCACMCVVVVCVCWVFVLLFLLVRLKQKHSKGRSFKSDSTNRMYIFRVVPTPVSSSND